MDLPGRAPQRVVGDVRSKHAPLDAGGLDDVPDRLIVPVEVVREPDEIEAGIAAEPASRPTPPSSQAASETNRAWGLSGVPRHGSRLPGTALPSRSTMCSAACGPRDLASEAPFACSGNEAYRGRADPITPARGARTTGCTGAQRHAPRPEVTTYRKGAVMQGSLGYAQAFPKIRALNREVRVDA